MCDCQTTIADSLLYVDVRVMISFTTENRSQGILCLARTDSLDSWKIFLMQPVTSGYCTDLVDQKCSPERPLHKI